MNPKQALLGIFIVLSAHNVLMVKSNALSEPSENKCPSFKLSPFFGWNSGCNYTAYFQESPHPDLVLYEHTKLNLFTQKRGVVAHVLWYRFVFSLRFRNEISVSYNQLDEMLFDLLKSNPRMISVVTSYLDHLKIKGKDKRAQAVLTRFCDTLEFKGHENLLRGLYEVLENLKLNYSTAACK